MTQTNIEVIAGQFGSLRELGRSMGVSHSVLSVWNKADGEIPFKYYQAVRDAADKRAREKASDGKWDSKEVKRFLTVIENCLRDDVCPTCGRVL